MLKTDFKYCMRYIVMGNLHENFRSIFKTNLQNSADSSLGIILWLHGSDLETSLWQQKKQSSAPVALAISKQLVLK